MNERLPFSKQLSVASLGSSVLGVFPICSIPALFWGNRQCRCMTFDPFSLILTRCSVKAYTWFCSARCSTFQRYLFFWSFSRDNAVHFLKVQCTVFLSPLSGFEIRGLFFLWYSLRFLFLSGKQGTSGNVFEGKPWQRSWLMSDKRDASRWSGSAVTHCHIFTWRTLVWYSESLDVWKMWLLYIIKQKLPSKMPVSDEAE